jgi:hypothetical protein
MLNQTLSPECVIDAVGPVPMSHPVATSPWYPLKSPMLP